MANKPINIVTATFDANDVANYLPLAAKATIDGKKTVDEGRAKGAAALAVMVAGFASDDVATRIWSFDIKGNSDDDVHTHVTCTGMDEFGNDDLEWKRNAQGAVSKFARSAYKTNLQNTFFNLPEPVPAVWTMASKAIPMARAIREEGRIATIEKGKLVLSGGTGERADKMRDAKNMSDLTKAAKGESGTNRAGHGNAKGDSDGEARVATPSEVLALAARLVEGAAKGEEALSDCALSFARKIAKLVADNPDAFAED